MKSLQEIATMQYLVHYKTLTNKIDMGFSDSLTSEIPGFIYIYLTDTSNWKLVSLVKCEIEPNPNYVKK